MNSLLIPEFLFVTRDLGRFVSHVELNVAKLSAKEITEVEDECNKIIRDGKPVEVQYLSIAQAMELEEVI